MGLEPNYPVTSKHMNSGTYNTLPLSVKGGTPGNTYKVYRQVEGQLAQFVTSGTIGATGIVWVNAEAIGDAEYQAVTPDGYLTGDRYSIIFYEEDGGGLVIGSVTFDFFGKPGITQEYYNVVPANSIAGQDTTAADGKGHAFGTLSVGENWPFNSTDVATGGDGTVAASGVALTAVGQCCPCAVGGIDGQTPGDSLDAPNGSTINICPLGGVASRGLPLFFYSSHCATERYKGPWGWYRSNGIYRKLLEQGPDYFGHVSIFRQDATRASYLLLPTGDYQSASGIYDSLVKTASGWFEKTKEGIYYEYNAHGNLKRVLDPNRNEHYYLYDNNTSGQKLTEIKATKGLRPYFYYTDPNPGNGTLNTRIALRDPNDAANNKYVYFKYDSDAYMTKAVGPEGCQWYFEYDKVGSGYNYPGKITKIIDPDGYLTYFGFDGAG